MIRSLQRPTLLTKPLYVRGNQLGLANLALQSIFCTVGLSSDKRCYAVHVGLFCIPNSRTVEDLKYPH
jgi:hypothetical protein